MRSLPHWLPVVISVWAFLRYWKSQGTRAKFGGRICIHLQKGGAGIVTPAAEYAGFLFLGSKLKAVVIVIEPAAS
jgi:hypothetical protein